MKIDQSDEGVLKRFMQEFFPFNEFLKIGFFTKEMRGNYALQSQRVCEFFGYATVYDYGAKEMSGHISYENPVGKPFITIIPSIYD